MALRTIVALGPAGEGLNEALASDADGVLLTLATDARPVGALRNTAIEALQRVSEAGKRGYVIANHPRTRLLRDDLDALVSPNLAGVFLSHASEPQDIRDAAVLLREFELPRSIEPGATALFPLIDSARGLLRAADMAQAAPRVAGIALDIDAYARDTGARAEAKGHRLAYARGAVVAAARAFDLLPVIVAGPLEVLDLANHGFAAIILPDFRGVASANAAFAPTAAELARASSHVALYDAARAEAAYVARDGATVIDAHVARKARQLLD
jgi:citrate lyase subunit beta/citryl-CoA lyase